MGLSQINRSKINMAAQHTPPNKPITILSIDGGGIRGIIPALVMAEIERRTEKPISALFDLVAGSSTGGLLALALAVPGEDGAPRYTAEQLPMLYQQHSKLIFSRTRWDAILSIDNWRVRRYPNTGISEALQDVFGDAKLTDVLTDVMVTSYDIERRMPWFFRSHRAKQVDQCNFLLRDVVRATTAAPTFFEPAQLHNHDDPDHPFALIDGSMTSINPALCAYVEAREMYPQAQDFIVVSLGTGNLTQSLPHQEVKNWGLLNWAKPLSDIMFDASSRTVDHHIEQLLPRGADNRSRYFRLQKRIEGVDHRMDDISDASLAMIREWGHELIADHHDLIDEMCEALLAASAVTQPPDNTPRRRFFALQSLAFWRSSDDDQPADIQQTGTG